MAAGGRGRGWRLVPARAAGPGQPAPRLPGNPGGTRAAAERAWHGPAASRGRAGGRRRAPPAERDRLRRLGGRGGRPGVRGGRGAERNPARDGHRGPLTGTAGRPAGRRDAALVASAGYSLVSWAGPTPEEHLDHMVALNRAGEDAPHDASHEEALWDGGRVRATDQRAPR